MGIGDKAVLESLGRFYFYRNTAGSNSINLPNGVYQITLTGGENTDGASGAQGSSVSGIVNGSVAATSSQTFTYTGSGTINYNLGRGGQRTVIVFCHAGTPGAFNCHMGGCSCHQTFYSSDGHIVIESIN